MSQPPVLALIVPAGKIVNFIDGRFSPETPEEYVRQEIEKSLVREYQYLREQIKVDPRRERRTDDLQGDD